MRIIGLFLVCSVCFTGYSFCDQKITYQSCCSKEVVRMDWSLEKKEDKIHLNGKRKGEEIQMEYSSDFLLLSYLEKKEPSKELDIVKEGPCLIIRSRDKGKEKIKSFKVGSTPWVQDWKFGLQNFLKGDRKEFSFYVVSPKDLSVYEMVATKEIEEELNLEGRKYVAQKVKITLKGFKKKFWKAQTWFDKENLLMLKYRANEGPGTPMTEITLLEEK